MAYFQPAGQQNTPFSRKSGGGDGKKFPNYPKDHLVTIESIDPDGHTFTGTNQEGKRLTYKISAAAYTRQEKGQSYQERFGHRIDAMMAKDFPVGHRVVLEKGVMVKNKEGFPVKVNGANLIEGNKVVNSTAQEADKLFAGLFTAARHKESTDDAGKLGSVQHWDPKAFPIGDKEAMAAFGAQLDEISAAYATGNKLPFRGFMFRTVQAQGELAVCFDSTEPFTIIPAVKDADGKEVAPYKPIDKATFISYAKQYLEYLKGAYPEFKEMGARVEVMTYTSYVATTKGKMVTWTKHFDKLAELTARKSKRSADDEEFFAGRNTGVNGIIMLSADDDSIVNKQLVLKPRSIANALFATNFHGDIRTMVQTSGGARVSLDPGLVVPVPKRDAFPSPLPPLPAATPVADPAASVSGQSMSEIAAELVNFQSWDDEDPFGDN